MAHIRLLMLLVLSFRILIEVPGYRTLIIIIILVITFMQGIYNYIPETNQVSRVYSVAAVLYLHFVLHVMLFRP
jgi:hypothetical protein